MNEEPHSSSIDPDLEARIVALVLGEASDFERDELHRLIKERPELGTFMAEIQSVHGLLQDVGAGESNPADDDWKLSAGKRQAVLGAISGQASEPAEIQLAVKSVDQGSPMRFLATIAKIAAVFLVVAFFVTMSVPSLRTARMSSPENRDYDSRAGIDHDAPAAGVFMADGEVTTDEGINGRAHWWSEGAAVPAEAMRAETAAPAEADFENESKSSLWSIRESLGTEAPSTEPSYYLQDDVQYFPARPGFRESHGASGFESAMPDASRRHRGTVSSEVDGSQPSLPTPDDLVLPYVTGSDRAASAEFSQTYRSLDGGMPDKKPDAGKNQNANQVGQGKVVFDAQPKRPPAMPKSGAKKSGQGQASFGDGAELGFSGDGDSPSDDVVRDGSSDEDELAGELMDRIVTTDAPATDAEPRSAETFEKQLGGSLKGDGYSKESRFSRQPQIVAGISGGEAEEPSFEAKPEMPAISGSANGGFFYAEDPQRAAESLEDKSEGVLDGLANTIAAGVSIDDDRTREGESNGRKIPKPTTGTPMGLPGPQSEKAKQGPGWGFGRQAIVPQGGPAQLNKGVSGELLEGEQASLFGVIPPTSTLGRFELKTKAPVNKSIAAGLNEKTAQDEAFSTFSLHVSDVSFKLARAALASGTWPDPGKIRIEEFVNALDYGDPMPSQSEKVACRVEQSIHPFLQQRNLLRVSMRTAAAGRSSNTPLRLTFLVDNSGSMERIDRQQTVRRAFALLAGQLKPIDQVTLISFARQPRLLADKVGGAQAQQLVQIIQNLPSEGGTNIEAALQLAFEKAQEHHAENAQNRIILLTDGAVNLGDADPESLSRMVATMRGAGIAFDAAGISAEGLNDEILEALTRKGDGRYYLLDSIEAADVGFARQIAGALRPSAKNVKIQVEFNPKRVGRYKLLGFEKHLLNKEDFRDDKVDAAEMAAAEAGVAMYQFEAKPDGEGDVGSVSVRFRDLSTGQMIENCWPIPYEADAPRLDQAAPSLRIAASAALLAATLRAEPLGGFVDLRTLSNLIAGLPDQYRNAPRVAELQQMIAQARQVSGK